MTDAPYIRVFLVDDHDLIREGLNARLQLADGIEVVGEACCGQDALRRIAYANPDVVLMDINLPDITGLEVTKLLTSKSPPKRVIMLSVHEEREYIEQAIQNGALGFILKDAKMDELLDAIQRCHKGEYAFSAKVVRMLASQSPVDQPAKAVENEFNLSARELEILTMVANGLSNKQIAFESAISIRTAETHRQNIREKLGAKNAADMTRAAISLGLI